VQAIRNPGMRQRHWEKISNDIGMPLYPDKKFTLVKADSMKLLDHLTAITKVSDVAGKEYGIEQVCVRVCVCLVCVCMYVCMCLWFVYMFVSCAPMWVSVGVLGCTCERRRAWS
jgi:hypothetical protein